MTARFLFVCTVIAGLLPSLWAGTSAWADDPNTCLSCHGSLEDDDLKSPVSGMALDVHARHGLSCVDCHGGNASVDDVDEAMDPDKGYVGAPERSEIPAFCGRCHQDADYMREFKPGVRVDQVELYWTSVHGHKLREGDGKVATCTDCHGHHGILPSSDPRSRVYPTNVPATCGGCHSDTGYMAEYGIPTNQFSDYKESVHGKLLLGKGGRGAPACNDCHGNHGAAPPGVGSVSNVCGQCHPVNADLLAQSPHAEAFQEEGIAACESCHGHHDVAHPHDGMLGTGEESACVDCHEPDSKGYLAAAAMQAAISRLVDKADEADGLLSKAERAGLEVREAKFQLNEVENNLTRARAAVHGFSLARLEAILAEGDSLAQATIAEGVGALEEIQYRRKGLGISLIFIAIVGIALFLKIREVDRRRNPQ